MLRTSTVEESTLVLLKKLQQTSLLNDLRLVGGTALALQLGHRASVDLDFFGKIDLTGSQIAEQLKTDGFDVLLKYDTKNIKVFFVDGVKVDMVNYSYDWLELPVETEGIRMAGLKDISAMKLSAITNRGTKKDFVDIYTLLQHFSIKDMVDFYTQKYPHGTAFSVIRSLCYFSDAETNPMPRIFIQTDWETIKSTIRETLNRELDNI
jgi:predicted nucleotidyltransferase component of viral defense system